MIRLWENRIRNQANHSQYNAVLNVGKLVPRQAFCRTSEFS
jgi:hypothetical protein